MSGWLRLPAERPLAVLAAVLLLSAVTGYGLVDFRSGEVQLRVDPSTGSLIPKGGEERELYERSRRLSGSDESIVIGLGTDEIFTPLVLERVQHLTRELGRLAGVQSVLSLSTAQTLRTHDGEVDVAPLLEAIPREPQAMSALRREALDHPLYGGTLVSRDGRATALLVSLDRMTDRELVESGIDARIESLARDEIGDIAEVWVAGVPHQKVFTSTRLTGELRWMLPAILGLVALVLLVSLRSIRGVILPFAGILLGLLWTLGTLALLGQELNLVTVTVPALVLTVGFSYALHVVSDFQAEMHGAVDRREAVRRTLDAVAVPVLVTGVTTAAGFVSLTLNPIPAIRQFGLFSLLGVAFAVLSSLTALPALLALAPIPARAAASEDGLLERLAGRLGDLAIRRRKAVIGVCCVLFAVAVAGMGWIRVAIVFPGNLDADQQVRRDWEAINANLGGATQVRILLESDLPDGILEPAHLSAIQALQEWLEAQEDVGETASLVDYLRVLNQALHDGDPAYLAVPETKRLASQLLLFGASPETQRLIDARRRTTTILVNLRVGDSDRIREAVDRIQARIAELPSGLVGAVTGSGALLLRVQDDVSRGQLVSIAAAFVLIYAVLVLMFSSFRVGLLALFPNALPIVVYFGALGISGVTLNPSTSLVGCLALGIAVDDTIHYFARFNAEAKRLADERIATRTALRSLIRPVTFTTVGLCLGFLVLTGSELGSQQQFGLLSAFTIGVAWLVDVTLSPALCSGVRIVTLWDVLRLDLGPEPHREIPLFHGLSLRGTRIFALMSDIVRLPAGEHLFREGDPGDDLFVVIHGELRAWVERRGERIEFDPIRRGATVGEVAYFARTRSANVEVVSDALLIRFDSEDLERLRRRYPRTAAVVYRNLSQILARRVVTSTERIR